MSRASGKRRFLYLTIAIIGIAIVMTFRWLGSSRSADFETGYRQAEQFYADGQLEQAKGVLKQLFERDHTDSPALLLSAKIYHETGQLEDAIQELDLIEHRSDRIWDEARQLKAEILHYELYHFQLAEEVYLEILSESPDDVFANDGYARLLGLCGRRWEAIPHVLRLIRAGQTTDLLMLLSRESGSLINSKMLETARRNHPEDPNPLLGLAHAANSSQDYQRSLQLLRQAESLPGLPDNFHGQLGQQLLNCDETSELKQWFQEFSADPQSFESWMLLGQISSSAGNQKSAIRCFWEAVRMQPESLQGNHQLAQSLITEKEIELAELFTQRVRLINQLRDIQRATIMVNHTPSQEDILELIQAYRQVGRLWEAYAWARSALLANPRNQKLIETVNSLSQEMIDLPLQLTQAKFNPAQELDFSHYPLPETFQTMGEQSLPANSLSLSFQNESANRGFHFEYYDGTPGTTYRMFELTGGGIAALDYDRDGAPDIFCSQGRAWDGQQTNSPAQTDRLFRNREGRSYQDVTAFAGFLNENGFGQGVSAGDYNNDGFVDLYVAQTGTNRLWKNNGDGTFSDATTDIKMQETRWTTSCLIADINGDSYPDLYDVNYLSAIDLFDRVCRDRKNIDDLCVPTDFDPASDRIWLGKGDGTFTDHTQDLLPESTNGKGLGILALRGEHGRLSLFVANDTVANHYYRFSSRTSRSMEDVAPLYGLAFNGVGKAEGCMGVAAADCNSDGFQDLYISNFLHESNTLYCGSESGLFHDRTQEYGLASPSLPVLGFGTQFLDADLDGQQELFLVNGYTHDLTRNGVPFAMPPHFYNWNGSGFHQLPLEQINLGEINSIVGRAVTRLDWNMDQLPDLVVGRIDGPSLLLTNTTKVENRSGVSFELVAKNTARDAIGTLVVVEMGAETRQYQLTSGDGYQCSNQKFIHVGCGSQSSIDKLRVIWPNEKTQEFFDVEVGQYYTIIEGSGIFPVTLTAR